MSIERRPPGGWSSGRIGDLFALVRGVSFPSGAQSKQLEAGLIACLRTTNVQSAVEWKDLWFIPRTYLRRPDQVVGLDDILISTANSLNLVGKVALVTDLPCEATLGAFIGLIRVPEQLSSRFVYYQMSSYDVQSAIRSHASTTTNISNVSMTKLSTVELMFPPLPEQHRIVAEIEKQFTRLDASLMALERVRAKLKRYRTSALNAAVTGRLSPIDRRAPHVDNNCSGADSAGPDLPAGWSANTGGRLFNFVTSGSRGWAKYYASTGAVFLRMGNLDHSTISLDLRRIQHVRPPESAEGRRTKVLPGDVLISITADVGMVAVAKHGIEETYINQHLALARPTSDANPAYLGWAIASPLGQKQFEELRRGATKVGLGLDDIRNLILPVPPRAEQDRIVAEIERRLSLVEKLEAVVDVAQKRAAALRQSILKRAFEGRLVAQDPDDEPAEVLLKRIRAERAASPANGNVANRAGRKEVRA